MFARMDIVGPGPVVGGFWSRPALIGISEEEVEASERRELDPRRAVEITMAMQAAAVAFGQRLPQGTC